MSPVTLEFRILGPLEVLGERGPVVLGGPRQRALLTVLLLEAGRVVATDRLVDLLWGEAAPRTATTSLQNAISKLRRELGPEILETRAPGYVLRVDPSSVDAHRFEQLVRDARRAEPEERRAVLEHALGLWRGSALAEFAFEQFAQPRSAGSRNSGSSRSKSASGPTSSSGATATSSASSRRSSASIRSARPSAGS